MAIVSHRPVQDASHVDFNCTTTAETLIISLVHARAYYALSVRVCDLAVCQLTKYRDYTHPIKEDVKKKFFSVPLEGNGAGRLHRALPPY